MMADIYPQQVQVLLLVALFVILFLPHLNRHNNYTRKAVIFLVLAIGARYLSWRLFVTTVPAPMPTGHGLWVWACFAGECMVLFEALTFYILMLRQSNHTPKADRLELALRSIPPENMPTVDVFIPTFNEDLDVVERSILGALHLDWPKEKLRVWVLDDGKREWLRDFCARKGAGYIRRGQNSHAKAGNINHALSLTKGDYIAIFDADFVPHRQFLYRTLGFFTDPKVAIVQTPQFFFNKDYVQNNLHLQKDFPDEQRIFFDVMMPSRDAWDAAFWCGSCSVARRRVMDEVGGVSTGSITEDLLTTLVTLRHGYVTRYLNEKLSHGLAPESLSALNTQRKRWCRGTIQAMYTRHGPFGPKLTFMQRFLFLPVHWIFSPLARLMNFLIPIVFLWTGLPALIISHFMYTVDYHAPFLLLNFFVIMWLAPRHHVPLLNTAMLSLSSLQILPNMIHSLFFPSKKDFAVTPKGKNSRKTGVDIYSLILSTSFFLLTVFGLILNLNRSYIDIGFFPIAAFWGTINILILALMIFLSFEHPKLRQEERFQVDKNFTLLANGEKQTIFIHNISMGGYSFLRNDQIKLERDQIISLDVPEVGLVSGAVTRITAKTVHVAFELMEEKIRDGMICHIFTGTYTNSTYMTSYSTVIKRLLSRAFGNHTHLNH